MTTASTARELVRVFRKAGYAHHLAFLATNGDDPEWPRWYAEYLRPKIEALLAARFEIADLAMLLQLAEDARQSRRPVPDWPEFYAEFFLERFAPVAEGIT
jgi:hypothetical protein